MMVPEKMPDGFVFASMLGRMQDNRELFMNDLPGITPEQVKVMNEKALIMTERAEARKKDAARNCMCIECGQCNSARNLKFKEYRLIRFWKKLKNLFA